MIKRTSGKKSLSSKFDKDRFYILEHQSRLERSRKNSREKELNSSVTLGRGHL